LLNILNNKMINKNKSKKQNKHKNTHTKTTNKSNKLPSTIQKYTTLSEQKYRRNRNHIDTPKDL